MRNAKIELGRTFFFQRDLKGGKEGAMVCYL